MPVLVYIGLQGFADGVCVFADSSEGIVIEGQRRDRRGLHRDVLRLTPL